MIKTAAALVAPCLLAAGNLQGAPSIWTEPASIEVNGTTATVTLYGALDRDGPSVTTWFEWGNTPGFTKQIMASPIVEWDGTTYLEATLTNLPTGYWYHYRLAAGTADGIQFRSKEETSYVPGISLNGKNPLGIPLGGTYGEAGATMSETPRQLRAGANHALLLRGDGTVSAWGDNHLGQTSVPPNASNIVAISAGGSHSAAVRSDGTAIAWGWNNYGQTNLTGAADIVAVSCGVYHTLALQANGKPIGWGSYLTYGLTNIPASATNVIAIATGAVHDLALRSDGTIVGWGQASKATPPEGATNVVAISVYAAGNHSLALRADGTVVAWGINTYGQTNVPASATNIVAIAAGTMNSSALRADGTLLVWGNDTNGLSTVPASATNIVDWAVGPDYACALRADGTIISWGDNSSGQTNAPSDTVVSVQNISVAGPGNTSFPGTYETTYQATDTWGTPARAARTVITYTPPDISLPEIHAVNSGTNLDLTLGGTVNPNGLDTAAWLSWAPMTGTNRTSALTGLGTGRLPIGISTSVSLPTNRSYTCQIMVSNQFETFASVPAVIWTPWLNRYGSASYTTNFGATFKDPGGSPKGLAIGLAGGDAFCVAVRPDGGISAGKSAYNAPSGASNLVAVAAGGTHLLGLREDGSLAAWGTNTYGELNVPSGKMIAIAAGQYHCLAVRANGTVVGWGNNGSGQCTPPKGLTGVKAVAAGNDFSMALKHDGTVVCWGSQTQGQGNVPSEATNLVAIAAGSYHALGIKADGALVAWGLNTSRQCTIPTNLGPVLAVAGGSGHTLVLKSNGWLAAWGDNSFLQTNAPGGNSFCQIASGPRHSMAAETSGYVRVWGEYTGHSGPGVAAPPTPTDANLPITRSGDARNPGTNVLLYTVSNRIGATATNTRTLIILPPAYENIPVQSISGTGGTARIVLTNSPGRTISVLCATNVTTPLGDWTVRGSMTEGPSGIYSFIDSAATNAPSRFYRFSAP